MENPVKARARRSVCVTLAPSAAVLLLGDAAQAQDPPVTNPPIAPAAQTATPEAQVVTTPPPSPAAAETAQELAPNAMLSNMRIRGYADVGFGKPLQEKLPAGGLQSSKNSFQIADF